MYVVYSQNDQAWKNKRLGNGSTDSTLGQYGCFVTSFANVCRWAGHPITPARMNDIMLQRGWFIDDLVAERKVPALLFPDTLEWAGEVFWNGPTDMGFFSDASDPNIAYIIWMDWSPAPGIQSHFSMVWAKEGDDLIIDDSWDGVRRRLSEYGSPSAIIQAAYKFKKITEEDMKMKFEDVVQAYWVGEHRDFSKGEVSRQEIDGQVGNQFTKMAAGMRESPKWLRDNHILKKAYPELVELQTTTLKDKEEVQHVLKAVEGERDDLKKQLEEERKPMIDKNTAVGKGIRTGLQAIVALPIAEILRVALEWVTYASNLPELQSIMQNGVTLGGLTALIAALIAYTQNKAESSLENKK